MICAPRQTFLLCVAALSLNAAASELDLSPANPLMEIFAGHAPFLSKDGKIQCRFSPAQDFCELMGFDTGISPGLKRAAARLEARDHSGFAREVSLTAAAPEDPGYQAARVFEGDCALQKKEWFRALAFYLPVCEKKNTPSSLALRAFSGALQALINVGRNDTALDLLRKKSSRFPKQKELWEKLTVLLLGRSGEYAELAQTWSQLKEKYPPVPDGLLFEGLFKGGEAAAVHLPASAAVFFADAFNFAENNGDRRNCLKKLILLQEKTSPERALRTIDRYLLFFPRSADAGVISLKKGEILSRLKNFSAALECYRGILNDKRFKIEERVRAAFQAAAISEGNGDMSMAREFYNSAIRRFAAYPEFANRVKMQLLEFLIRTKEFSSAAVLGEELSGLPGVDPQRLAIFRMKALSELKRYAEAAQIAAELADSAEKFWAAEGAWQLARLTELQQKNKEARRLYLDFSQKFPNDQRVPYAILAAADFAVKERNFESAAKELEAFLQKFPYHAGARKAMFAAVFSLLHHDTPENRDKAELMLQKIKTLYPNTDESDGAVLEMIRYYNKKEEFASALKLLDAFRKERPASKQMPEVLIQGGRILEKMENLKKAVEYVDLLLDKYPNSSLAVEAAMLGGSCCFQEGNYQRALKYYERACDLGGRGVMAQVAAGEAADCHLQLRKKENIAAAISIYRDLAKRSEYPAVKIQALYKLGMAFEYDDKSMKALETYEELLLAAVGSEKIRRSSGVALWCSRAARSALRIILGNSHLPDGSQRAQRLYYLYSQLELPGSGTELRRYLEEIRKHYNLLD